MQKSVRIFSEWNSQTRYQTESQTHLNHKHENNRLYFLRLSRRIWLNKHANVVVSFLFCFFSHFHFLFSKVLLAHRRTYIFVMSAENTEKYTRWFRNECLCHSQSINAERKSVEFGIPTHLEVKLFVTTTSIPYGCCWSNCTLTRHQRAGP